MGVAGAAVTTLMVGRGVGVLTTTLPAVVAAVAGAGVAVVKVMTLDWGWAVTRGTAETAGFAVWPETVPQSFHPPPVVGVGVAAGCGVCAMPLLVTAICCGPPKRFWVTTTTVSGVTATVAVGARVWKGRFPLFVVMFPLLLMSSGAI